MKLQSSYLKIKMKLISFFDLVIKQRLTLQESGRGESESC
jgi:hypothetical protein